MKVIFDSRKIAHKSVFGAVCTGETIRLRLLLSGGCSSPAFVLRSAGRPAEHYPMVYDGKGADGASWWKFDWKTENCGLYFYNFSVTCPDGIKPVFKGERGEAAEWPSGKLWQQTVYNPDSRYPDWLTGGVIYQIFPDRFCFSGRPKDGVPDDRCIREDWKGQPFFENNGSPQRINNDYWQGDLKGIISRLDDLAELGVTAIYLNPVFEAHANHRYNTADYEKIDPMLGSGADFRLLCGEAEKHGISIILDGVFSHTGSDSRYFNLYGRYGSGGAARDEHSPYKEWYTFTNWPDEYKCWWDIKSLPETNELNGSFLEYVTGRNGIARQWLREGAKGWRLDVADELPDGFLDRFYAAVKAENPQAAIIGEVWEDASNKQSYGSYRRYLQGGQLDSVMNYPFRNAIVDFLGGGDGDKLMECVMTILENYPKPCTDLLMNVLGTHDTERIITALSKKDVKRLSRSEQALFKLTQSERHRGVKFAKLAAALSYTLPGVPSIYYGDEIAMEGGGDPFNRAPYAYKNADGDMLRFYKKLGRIRKENACFRKDEFVPLKAELGHIAYMRKTPGNSVLIAVNRWCDAISLPLPAGFERCEALLGKSPEKGFYTVAGESVSIIKAI